MGIENDRDTESYNNIVKEWRETKSLHDNLDNFYIKFTYNSGKIENDKVTYNDTRELFETGEVKKFSGDVITILELLNHKRFINNIESFLNFKVSLTISFIKDVHKSLLKGCYTDKLINKGERPVNFKKGDYVVGLKDVGSHSDNESLDLLFEFLKAQCVKTWTRTRKSVKELEQRIFNK